MRIAALCVLTFIYANLVQASEITALEKIEGQSYSMIGGHSEDGVALPVVVSGPDRTGGRLLIFDSKESAKGHDLQLPNGTSLFGSSWVKLSDGLLVSGLLGKGRPAAFLFNGVGRHLATAVVGDESPPVFARCTERLLLFGKTASGVEIKAMSIATLKFSESVEISISGTPLDAACLGEHIFLTVRGADSEKSLVVLSKSLRLVERAPINFRTGQLQLIDKSAVIVVTDGNQNFIQAFNGALHSMWRVPITADGQPANRVRMASSGNQLFVVGFRSNALFVSAFDPRGNRMDTVIDKKSIVPTFDDLPSISARAGVVHVVGDIVSESDPKQYTIYHATITFK